MQLKIAEQIAVSICYQLQPFCSKINIAGSVRRKKAEVKDIEIICVPKFDEVKDLFESVCGKKISAEFSEIVNGLGTIIKGNADGRMMQIQLQEGIMLDLFMPVPDDYYRQYAIRTGSADYAHRVIANAWNKKGWCGSDKGLRKMSDCIEMKTTDGKSKWKLIKKDADLPPVWRSEEEFFKWLKIPCEKPLHRL